VSKTIREWLEQLPEPERSQAIGQTRKKQLRKVVCSMPEAIEGMFIWRDSLQGDAQWHDVYQRAERGEFDRPAEQPTAFPDDASVLRAQVVKLAAENARLEREVERLNEKIADIKAACWEGKQQVKYGCHCDLQPGQTPDGCVIDDNMPGLCDHAGKFLRKEECPEWRPIKQQGQ
jgi:hypothetical protein